jgi:hypothetical protein
VANSLGLSRSYFSFGHLADLARRSASLRFRARSGPASVLEIGAGDPRTPAASLGSLAGSSSRLRRLSPFHIADAMHFVPSPARMLLRCRANGARIYLVFLFYKNIATPRFRKRNLRGRRHSRSVEKRQIKFLRAIGCVRPPTDTQLLENGV